MLAKVFRVGHKFYDKSKALIHASPEPFIGLELQYIRPLDLYFNQSHRKPATSLARLFDERGNTRETYPYPGILWRWADEVSGTADNAWTQAGLIWNVLVGSRDERNGLYLQAKDGRFIKISRTRLSGIRMSPDGCRLPILGVRRSSSLFGLGVGAYHEFFTIYNFCTK